MSEDISDSYQDKRRKAIEDAAYAVLAEKGYKAASMLAIARKAKASNETLYNWYGNKQKLFGSLVQGNTKTIRHLLSDQQEPLTEKPIIEALELLGVLLLELVTSERAIALNRAAAGDVHDTGTLGKTIAESGKQTILPLVSDLFENARKAGALDYGDQDQVAETWISLLIGDLQIQRVIGVREALTEQQLNARAKRAAALIGKLFVV